MQSVIIFIIQGVQNPVLNSYTIETIAKRMVKFCLVHNEDMGSCLT